MVSVTTKQLTGSKPAALALTLVTTDIQYNQNQPPAPLHTKEVEVKEVKVKEVELTTSKTAKIIIPTTKITATKTAVD